MAMNSSCVAADPKQRKGIMWAFMDALANYLAPSSEILEVFIDWQRLTTQERVDFLAEASLADEDRRADR